MVNGNGLISQKKKKSVLTSKCANLIVLTMILTAVMLAVPVYADALDTAKSLLSKGATAGGGLWAVWGLVQLGISIKDHNGPGIQGAIWQIIGGGIIIAAGAAVASLDLTFTA